MRKLDSLVINTTCKFMKQWNAYSEFRTFVVETEVERTK